MTLVSGLPAGAGLLLTHLIETERLADQEPEKYNLQQVLDLLFPGLKFVKVALSAAQLKTGQSVPIDAAPAPGAGKINKLIAGILNFKGGATGLDVGDQLQIWAETGGYQLATARGFAGATTAEMIYFTIEYLSLGSGTQFVANKKLQLKMDADSAVGDVTADAYLFYQEMTL